MPDPALGSAFGSLGSAALGATPYGAALGAAGNIATGVIGALNQPAPPQDTAKAGIRQTGSKSKDVFQFFSIAPNVTIAGAGARTETSGSPFAPDLTQRREFQGGSPTAAASLAKSTEGSAQSEATASQGGLGTLLSGSTGRLALIAGAVVLGLFVLLKFFRK